MKQVKVVEWGDYSSDFEKKLNAALQELGDKVIDIKYTTGGYKDKLYYQAYILYEA